MTKTTGSVFSLARWFQAPEDISGADAPIGPDGMDARERILSDLYRRARKVAVKTSDIDGKVTTLVVTDVGAAMIEVGGDVPEGMVVFDYVENARWGRKRFWMNASSVKTLGDHLRTLPRADFDALFVGAES